MPPDAADALQVRRRRRACWQVEAADRPHAGRAAEAASWCWCRRTPAARCRTPPRRRSPGAARRPVRRGGRACPTSASRVAGGTTAFKLWAPTAQKVAVAIYDDGVGLTTGDAAGHASTPPPASGRASARRRPLGPLLPLRGRGASCAASASCASSSPTPTRSACRPTPRAATSPTSHSPALKPAGLGRRTRRRPTVRGADRHDDLRAARARLLGQRLQRARRANRGKYLAFTEIGSDGMRHLQALAEAGLTDVHLLPVFDLATVPETGCVTPATGGARRRPSAAGGGDRGERRGLLQLGLRPVPLQRARGQLCQRRRRRRGAHRRVPRAWCRRCTRPGCAWAWTSSTTTPRPRASSDKVGARPRRARLLPPPERPAARSRRSTCCDEHGDRAPDDGQAHDRLGGAVGARLQDRLVPLRPDGPPAARGDGAAAGGASTPRPAATCS
ncbi:MAG: hypothetical protein MZW92_66530 [Comamonadaceae bacterium]|nr:hypothetical protein [Comamonadaceae bacterium]